MLTLVENLQLDFEIVATEDISEAIYLFENGAMISGEYDCGIRGTDHNGLKSEFPELSWLEMLEQLGVIMLVPEEGVAYKAPTMHPSEEILGMLDDALYTLEDFC